MNVNHGITDTGKLKTIEIDKYEPIPDKPGRCRAVGQASKQEIFDQLKDHLEYVGMLPDEYFIISTQQPEIIPENWRDFTCNVDDLSNVLLVVAPIAGTACVIYFAVRHGAADEMDQKKWKQRIVVAVVSIVVAVVASALIKVLVSYYQ